MQLHFLGAAFVTMPFDHQVHFGKSKTFRQINLRQFGIGQAKGFVTDHAVKVNMQMTVFSWAASVIAKRILVRTGAIIDQMYQAFFFKGFERPVNGDPISGTHPLLDIVQAKRRTL